jgi:hypothetical protein
MGWNGEGREGRGWYGLVWRWIGKVATEEITFKSVALIALKWAGMDRKVGIWIGSVRNGKVNGHSGDHVQMNGPKNQNPKQRRVTKMTKKKKATKKADSNSITKQRVKTSQGVLTQCTISNVKRDGNTFTGTTKVGKKKAEVVHQYSDVWKVK